MEPLFPRIHVKDIKKEVAKPPPRNKMALYEEVAKPSNNRLAQGSTTISTLRSNDHGGGSERRIGSPFFRPCNDPMINSNQGNILNPIRNGLKRANIFDHGPNVHAKISTAGDQSLSWECRGSSKRLASNVDVKGNVLSHESSKSLSSNGVRDKNENVSGTRELDYKMSVNISFNDGMLKMGQENFWKIRIVLINQQRIFSFQVFELHRLVKVQKSLARSPRNFLKHNLCLHKCFHKVPNKEELLVPPPSPPPPAPPPPPPPSSSLSLPPPKNKNPTPLINSHGSIRPPCFYTHLQNQLLIPIMSSEGLVYKPMNARSSNGSHFLNATYGFPIALPYTDPHGLSISNSTSHDVIEDKGGNGRIAAGSSSDIDLQGSTGSSSVGRASHDALPLFPTEPSLARNDNGGVGNETLAIKPVPLYGKLTNESALKIYRSIQEERKKSEADE